MESPALPYTRHSYRIKNARNPDGKSVTEVYGLKEREKYVIWDESKHDFLVFQDKKTFFDWYLTEADRTYHESIYETRAQRLRWDIDDHAGDPALVRQTVKDLIATICDEVLTVYRIPVDPTRDIVVFDSNGPEGKRVKCSYHVMYLPMYAQNCYEAAAFSKGVVARLPREEQQFIDQSVNSRNHNFRIVGSHKAGSTRVKKLCSEFNTAMPDIRDCLVVGDTDAICLPALLPPGRESGDKGFEVSDDLQKRIIALPGVAAAAKGWILRDFQPHWTGTRINWNRPDRCAPINPVCGLAHHKDHSLYMRVEKVELGEADAKNGGDSADYRVWGYCRQCPKAVAVLLDNTRKEVKMCLIKELVVKINKRIEENHGTLPVVTAFDQLPAEYKEEYCLPAMRPYRVSPTLAVRAGMGIGKTKALRDYLPKCGRFCAGGDSDCHVVISPRVVFGEDFRAKFREFELYSEIKEQGIDLNEHPNVIAQAESIHRILPTRRGRHLIIDECESVFSQLMSGLHGNLSADYATLKWLIGSFEYVTCMDANLGELTYRVLTRLRADYAVQYVHNSYLSATSKTMEIVGDETAWVSMLFDDLKAGRNLFVVSNVLKKLKMVDKAVMTRFPELEGKTLMCTSEMPTRKKREIFSDVKQFGKYRIVYISPTVTAGISFELTHFAKTYCFFNDSSCSVEDCRQMMGRVRDLSENKFVIFLKGNRKYLPETMNDLIHNFTYKRSILTTPEYGGIAHDIEYTHDGRIGYTSDARFEIFAAIKLNQNRSKNNFIQRFLVQIAATGAKLVYVAAKKDEEIKGELKAARGEIKMDQARALAAAPLVNELDYLALRSKRDADDDEIGDKLKMEKYQLAKCFRVPMDSAEFVVKYLTQKTRSVYSNWRAMLTYPTIERALGELGTIDGRSCAFYESTSDHGKLLDLFDSGSVYISNRLAHGLLRCLGLSDITDASTIYLPMAIMRMRYSGLEYLQSNYPAILSQFQLRKRVTISLLATMAGDTMISNILEKIINPVLSEMYGLKFDIAWKSGPKQAYRLKLTREGKKFACLRDGEVTDLLGIGVGNKSLPTIVNHLTTNVNISEAWILDMLHMMYPCARSDAVVEEIDGDLE